MTFKLKSGNKPKFKEMGSSPLKAPLAEPEYHYTPDVPSEVIVGSDQSDLDPASGAWRAEDVKKEVEETNGEKKTEEQIEGAGIEGTGEDYKSRKQRRADRKYHKAQARLMDPEGKLRPEVRRDIKIHDLQEQQKEALSKGTTSYNVKWGLGKGLQESLEPKADKLQRKIDKLEEKQPDSELSKTKAKTKEFKKQRKEKKKKGDYNGKESIEKDSAEGKKK